MSTPTRRRRAHFLAIQSNDSQSFPVLLDDRAAITPGSGLDLLITAFEEMAYHGWQKGTPASITVALEDGRTYTLLPGPAFLAADNPPPPSPGKIRIPVYVVDAEPHPDLVHTLHLAR